MALWGKHDYKTVNDGTNDCEVTAVSGNKVTVNTIDEGGPSEIKIGDQIYINMHMFGSTDALPSAGVVANVEPNGSNWDITFEANGQTWGFIPERNHNTESGIGYESGRATLEEWSDGLSGFGATGGILWNAGGNNSDTGAKLGKLDSPKFIRNYLVGRWTKYTAGPGVQHGHSETSEKYTFFASSPATIAHRSANDPFGGGTSTGNQPGPRYPIEDANLLTGTIGELCGPIGLVRSSTACVNADVVEAAASSKITHAGWNLQTAKLRADGNGGWTVAYNYECLVAQGNPTGTDKGGSGDQI